MSDIDNAQSQPAGTEQSAITWDLIAHMTREQHAARRPEIKDFMSKNPAKNIGRPGTVIPLTPSDATGVVGQTSPDPKAPKKITWDFIGRMSKAEYTARREEVQQFMSTHSRGSGRRFD